MTNSETAALMQSGAAHCKAKAFNAAIADFTRVIDANPKIAAAWYNRGYAWYRKGDKERAIADFEQAAALAPENARYRETLEKAQGKKQEDAPEERIQQKRRSAGSRLPNRRNDMLNLISRIVDFLKSLKNRREEVKEFTGSIRRSGAVSRTGNFLKTLKNRMGIGSPERNATDTYERGMAIVPECIRANENEIPVKQFNIAVLRSLLKFERAEGRMQVTNKRVIFRAAGRSVGGRTTLQHEYAIDEIAGIEARTNYKFSFLYLVFAALIIALAFFIIHGPSAVSSIMSLNNSHRISGMMFPKHVQRAYGAEAAAIAQTQQAGEKVSIANEKIEPAKEAEAEAANIAEIGILKTRRVQRSDRWNTWYVNERYRDTSPEGLQEAKELLDAATAEREKAEEEAQAAIAELEAAQKNVVKAIQKRVRAVNVWKVLMTLWGLILGFGGLLPFFVLYKKFGLKLFILVLSNFGFSLAFAASQIRVFNWLSTFSVILFLACIFIFCFRPNLVISIKNKMGSGKGPVDIRCDENLNRAMEAVSFMILLAPIIIFGCLYLLSNAAGMLGSAAGFITPFVIPVILVILSVSVIIRLLKKDNEDTGASTGFAEVFPTEETESAIREMGAMIGDIQKLGDLGIDKWVKK